MMSTSGDWHTIIISSALKNYVSDDVASLLNEYSLATIRCMIRCVVRYDYYRLHDFSSFISISRWFLIMHVPVLILVINNSLAHNLLHDVSEQNRNRIGTTLGHKHCQTKVDCFNEGPHD